MRTIIFTFIFCCIAILAVSQNNNVKLRKNRKGIVECAVFPMQQAGQLKQNKVPKTADDFFRDYLNVPSSVSFEKKARKQWKKDFVHERYDQYYKGIKVDGASYSFHYEIGRMYLAHGNYARVENVNITPTIKGEEAREAFARYKDIPLKAISDYKAELLIKEITTIVDAGTSYLTFLVYKVYLFSEHSNNNETGYVDAHSGKVLLTIPNLTGYSATATFATRYSGTRQSTTQYYNNNFNLCDSTRGAVIRTCNLNGSININNAVELTDVDNNWTAGEFANNEDDMGLDIHWALHEIYDYFNEKYAISSFDNNDAIIRAYFHFGTDQGDRDNAGWNPTLKVLVFGDGANRFTPVASLDAVAHEYGHGITDFQIGWEYSGDRAAFHEGLSDIWGVILENRISPNSIWDIGEQVIIGFDCLRNIQNPSDPDAGTQIADTYLSNEYNVGNQYTRSGVFSHWFYLLVNGGIGMNANGDTYTVYGIGMDAAEKLIVEAVFNGYLDNGIDTYPEIRDQIIAAAESSALFGPNSFQTVQVANAWYAVGVGTEIQPVNLTGSVIVCSTGTTVTANNVPYVSNISWKKSSNLILYSGGSTATPVFKPISSSTSGAGWVQPVFTTNGYSTVGPKKDIWVGKPAKPILTCPYRKVGMNSRLELFADAGGAIEYDWKMGGGTVTYGQGTGNVWVRTSSHCQYDLYIRVNASNSCGTGPTTTKNVPFDCSGAQNPLSMAPNPVRNQVEIEVPDIQELNSTRMTYPKADVMSSTKKYLVTVTNMHGIPVMQSSFGNSKFTINTSSWQPGIYFIKVIHNDKVFASTIVKE
ncbi:MAG: M4 family metallopeptidase [Marinilabiliaceae bacterium]|nr:M4 family metallopeptidase [Marinilabiliaceae bacterium]